MTTKKTIRCAVYTRKSTDEGLEQEFNTLAAQREACAAYIKSQAHEGWRLIPEQFDDGGHSGGTLQRPSMQRLLERVRARQIDVILIYKIDRLTRSLADFAKLAEEFDKFGVSFVSVTQQFNTTTSMGRLMLNVLLSFAQFEREIAGERIRDKIAASKKKGMWMGGSVPLGYDWKDRALIINQAEAKTVRTIFRLYLKKGNVRAVTSEAGHLGLKTKMRTTSGRPSGGKPFCRGHIYALLANPIYVGRITHKDDSFSAAHKPIVDDDTWQKVQKRLAENRKPRSKKSEKESSPSNLLTGLLFDTDGNRFTSSFSVKNGRRYRYYVEQPLVTGESAAKSKLRRIPAAEIERTVVTGICEFLSSPPRLLEALGHKQEARLVSAAIANAAGIARRVREAPQACLLQQDGAVLERVTIHAAKLDIQLSAGALRAALSIPALPSKNSPVCQISMPLRIGNRGSQMKLTVSTNVAEVSQANEALVKALAQARLWFGQLLRGEAQSINEIAAVEKKAASYIGRVLRLAFLAPTMQEEIVEARQCPELTAKRLILREILPLDWQSQNSKLSY